MSTMELMEILKEPRPAVAVILVDESGLSEVQEPALDQVSLYLMVSTGKIGGYPSPLARSSHWPPLRIRYHKAMPATLTWDGKRSVRS
jgi:hypothetical protein